MSDSDSDSIYSLKPPRPTIWHRHVNFDATKFHHLVQQYQHDLTDVKKSPEVQDVVVILGHLSALCCSPTATEDLLVALTKLKPTIVTFMCCGGGNDRHGPILKLAHLLYPKCIVGYFQRRVYVEELHETCLVVGLQNFLYMISHHYQEMLSEETVSVAGKLGKYKLENMKHLTAIKAFGCAKLGEWDPTVFKNDSQELSIAEILQNAGFNPAQDHVIPVSFFQLAMYHQMILDSDMQNPVNVSMISIARNSSNSFFELNKRSVEESEKYQLNKIIPLILEIGLIKLYKESLDLIKTGNSKSWMRVDHLQFLLAMLRGHWGRNSLAIVRKWASFHLMEMMCECAAKSKENVYVHKYQLCCICYVLLCKNHFVKFLDPSEHYHDLEILACTTLEDDEQYYGVTFEGYIGKNKAVCRDKADELPDPITSFNGTELSWHEVFQYCEHKGNFVDMYYNNIPFKMDNYIGGGGGAATVSPTRAGYQYKSIDFKLAMIALADGFLHSKYDAHLGRTLRTKSYHLKQFNNKCDDKTAIMKIFDKERMQYFTTKDDYTFYEMRVVIDKSKLKVKRTKATVNPSTEAAAYHDTTEDKSPIGKLCSEYSDHTKTYVEIFNNEDIYDKLHEYKDLKIDLNACRFVFAKYTEPPRPDQPIRGVLFYTDSHYGQNLIDFCDLPFLEQPPLCQFKCFTTVMAHPNTSFMKKSNLLCKLCLYKMQEVMIDKINRDESDMDPKFPFCNVGKLTLIHEDRLLKTIHLECAVLICNL